MFDLSGAFRLRDADLREVVPHTPAGESGATYGLTEHYREELKTASLVACAGAIRTAAILSLSRGRRGPPGTWTHRDAKSGYGCRKDAERATHFSECTAVSRPRGFAHRHAAGSSRSGRARTFVPHLIQSIAGFRNDLRAASPGVGASRSRQPEYAYGGSPFVRLTGSDLPEIKHVAHKPTSATSAGATTAGGQVVMVAVIDNLVKGASPGDPELQRGVRSGRHAGIELTMRLF